MYVYVIAIEYKNGYCFLHFLTQEFDWEVDIIFSKVNIILSKAAERTRARKCPCKGSKIIAIRKMFTYERYRESNPLYEWPIKTFLKMNIESKN